MTFVIHRTTPTKNGRIYFLLMGDREHLIKISQHRKPQHVYKDGNHLKHLLDISGNSLETNNKTINRIYYIIPY